MSKLNRVNRALFSSLILTATSGAMAGSSYGQSNGFYDQAKVTQAEAIFETVERRVPREECWNEKIEYAPEPRYGRHYSRRQSSTPLILGALIGGALGNELGHSKKNKQVGAVAGAILGGSIGRDVGRQRNRERGHDGYQDQSYDVAYRTEQRCKTYYDIETEERLTGYQVSYLYNGHEYQTITDQHPGKRLRVRVGVRPAE